MTPITIRSSTRGNGHSSSSSSSNSSSRHKLSRLRTIGFYLFTSVVFLYTSFLIQLIYRYHGSSSHSSSNIINNDTVMNGHLLIEQQKQAAPPQDPDPASNVLYPQYGNNHGKYYSSTIHKRVTKKIHPINNSWTLPKQLQHANIEAWYRTEQPKTKHAIQTRNRQRRQRTQQHPTAVDSTIQYNLATLHTPQQQQPSPTTTLPSEMMPYILCSTPNNSTSASSFAINSRSTVLITGIFSNSIGVNLALYLYTHCGVTNIVGIDPLLPNTQTHRLRVTFGQQALLMKTIPNFIFHKPHMGVQTSATASRDDEEEAAEKGPSYYNIVERYSPTHIVHLLSINSQHVYTRHSAGGPQENPIIDHVDNPYHDSFFIRKKKNYTSKEEAEEEEVEASSWWSAYGPSRPINMLRQNRFAMEHILKSVSQVQWKQQLMDLHRAANTASQQDVLHEQTTTTTTTLNGKLLSPRLVYVSCQDGSDYSPAGRIQAIIPEVQDALASSYAVMHDVSSIGLRFGTVYGPWDHFLTPMYQMAERTIKTLGSPIPPIFDDDDQLNLIYVDDTVSAIVSAMQLDISEVKLQQSNHVVFRLDTGERHALRKVSQMMEDIFPRGNISTTNGNTTSSNSLFLGAVEDQKQPSLLLTWKACTSLSQGIPKLLAWHYEVAHIFGQSPFELPSKSIAQASFEQTVRERGLTLLHSEIGNCSSSDVHCLRGLVTSRFPCSSECALSQSLCTRSMFDSVLDIVREATQGCKAVLYTISLGRNSDSIPHRLGPNDPHFDGYNVCNIVFISRRSPLARKIVSSIPVDDNNINNTGVAVPIEGLSELEIEDRLNMFNCKVETDGWTTCWVPTDVTATSIMNEMFMLKTSPGRFFASSVKYSMFVDAAFPVLPTQDDVEFLLSQVYRESQPERLVTYRVKNSEPRDGGRKTSNGAPQMVYKYKIPPKPARRAILFVSPLRTLELDANKLTIRSASRLMLEEIGRYEETDYLKLQRAFYEGIPAKVNKEEQRSMYEPLHKYTLSPFYIRSKWIIHDMTLEEARQLRCDWFQEHSFWGGELDSFSLAAILARRDVERRINWGEQDQRAIVNTPEIPEKLTDDNDWKMVWTEDTARFLTSNMKGKGVAPDPKRAGLYVRIISDDEMLSARKQWVSRNEVVEGK